MTVQPVDLHETLRQLRKDLTTCQARLTDALNQLSALGLPTTIAEPCPSCGCRGTHTFSCPIGGHDATTALLDLTT